jgi:predicted ATPase
MRVQGVFGEILIKEPGGRSFANVADVGFGYAEVLPLCATLWSSCVREPSPKRRRTSLLALEQPELHLHPAHQARLADIIAGAWRTSRDAGREVNLMVETHSEGLVNRMGELVHDGVLRASDVQILVFNQDPDTRQTEVRIAGYTAEGALNDAWPFGFFAAVAD